MKIHRLWFKDRDKELHLTGKPYKSGCHCPECGDVAGRMSDKRFPMPGRFDLMAMKVLLW
jgi:hypothetical protein